jgi:predicted amidophosphoribosyltransferase
MQARIPPVRVARLFAEAAEVALPSLCPSCQMPLSGADRGLCRECWSRLVPLSGDRCGRCGGPATTGDEPCLACTAEPPPQQGTVVWGEYEGVLRSAILALKHHGHDELAEPLAERLAARARLAPWADEVTLVVPVPSHPLHRLRRGWTAAELLAHEVARRWRVPAVTGLRRRGLGRQAGRSRAQRLALSSDTFSARADLAGAPVLVVDDVTTTGATLSRVARALLDAGAGTVFCAAVAFAPQGRIGS